MARRLPAPRPFGTDARIRSPQIFLSRAGTGFGRPICREPIETAEGRPEGRPQGADRGRSATDHQGRERQAAQTGCRSVGMRKSAHFQRDFRRLCDSGLPAGDRCGLAAGTRCRRCRDGDGQCVVVSCSKRSSGSDTLKSANSSFAARLSDAASRCPSCSRTFNSAAGCMLNSRSPIPINRGT